MRVLCNYGGWFPVERGIFNTSVWRDENAFRVYMAFLASATHREIVEPVGSSLVRLAPGQLTATQAEICGMTGYGRNAVRSAIRVLKGEGAIDCGVPRDRRFSVVTVRRLPLSIQGEEGRGSGTPPPPTGTAKIHQPFDGRNPRIFSGFGIREKAADTDLFSGNAPALYRNKECKEYKEKKNILFSSSVLSILSLWRNAREKAGEAYCEDPVTLEGAAAMAELWLDAGRATESVIAAAMRKFVQVVKTNESARLYTLKTLAHSFGTYIEKPAAVPVKRYSWTFTCDVCRYTSASFHKEAETPRAIPCGRMLDRETRCAGTMIPTRDSA